MPYQPVYVNCYLRVEQMGSDHWAKLVRKHVPLRAIPLPGHLLKFGEIEDEMAVEKVVFFVDKASEVVVTLKTVEAVDLIDLVDRLIEPEGRWTEIERSI